MQHVNMCGYHKMNLLFFFILFMYYLSQLSICFLSPICTQNLTQTVNQLRHDDHVAAPDAVVGDNLVPADAGQQLLRVCGGHRP